MRQQFVQLVNGRYVKIGALVAKRPDDLGRGVCLDRIVHARVGEEVLQRIVRILDRCDVYHDERSFLGISQGLDTPEGFRIVEVFHASVFCVH